MARYDQIADSVEDRFDQTEAYADEAWAAAQTYLSDLANLIPPEYDFESVDFSWTDIPIDMGSAVTPDRPTFDLTIPDLPSAATIPDVSVDPITVPDFEVVPPSYNYPDKPTEEFPDLDAEAPTDEEIDFPTVPEYTLPTTPTFDDDISIPDPPDVTLPDFSDTAPDFTVEAPGDSFVYGETPYSSTLLDEVKSWLETQIEDGGTGLASDVEEALINRAQARKEIERQSKYAEAEQYFSGRGHTLPPGALSGRLLNIQEQIGKETQQQDDDILIEQARLAQTNTHFAVEQAGKLEATLIAHFNTTAQRTFEVARVRQQVAMDIFNAAVAHYNAENEGYKTAAAVYETRIKASTLILEQYKLTLEGKELQGKLREIVLNQYNLELQGVKTLVDLYATEMGAAKIKSDINVSRIEGYRARIEAYNSRIGAITAKYNAYQAELAGEETKAKVYMTQVQAYSERVKAIAVGADVDIENAKIQMEEGRLDIERYKGELEGYKAELGAGVSEMETESKVYTAQVGGYEAEIKALIADADAQIESYKARAEHERNMVNQAISQAEVAMQHARNVYGIQVEQYKAGAEVTAQVSASALSAVTAGATYGYNEGVNTGYTYDQTKGVPTTSYQYSY